MHLKLEKSRKICFKIGEKHFAGCINIFIFDFARYLSIVGEKKFVEKTKFKNILSI